MSNFFFLIQNIMTGLREINDIAFIYKTYRS